MDEILILILLFIHSPTWLDKKGDKINKKPSHTHTHTTRLLVLILKD